MADLTKMAPSEIAEEHANRGARSLSEGLVRLAGLDA